MAAYFDGATEIQADALQTLYLLNPAYVTAPPAAHRTNMVFLNSPLDSLHPVPQHHLQLQPRHPHFVGTPLRPPNEHNLWAPSPPPPPPISAVGPGRQRGLSMSGGGGEAKTNGVAGLQSVLMGSKYLKAARQLLDEVAGVGEGRSETATTANEPRPKSKDLEGDQGSDGGGGGKKESDISTAERAQELQTKKDRLVNMLDEVEQRYRRYRQQMQIVVSSFEAAAGFGSAETYTALALQTISRQFRCLRDAIACQIRAASKSLGEEDGFAAGGSKLSVGSRLRSVDHHLRQQRALQQLGMVQNNAWRPQRGLPERAVSVLRAWLFEHFLHPYPKDSDKHMLAKQAGLTRSQVSNWFINARVRLWKPMVEEMYLEETKEREQNDGNSNKGEDNTTSGSDASEPSTQQAHSSTPSRTDHNPKPPPQQQAQVHASDSAMFNMQQRLTKARSDESPSLHQTAIQNQMGMGMGMKQNELSNRDLLMKLMDQGGGFGAYGPVGEMGRFGHHEQFAPRFGGNGVSLTLGLPHCEALPLSGSQQPSYLSNESMLMGRRLGLSSEENINYFSLNSSSSDGNNPTASHDSNAYESVNMQSRKRFAAQLLPDFVA